VGNDYEEEIKTNALVKKYVKLLDTNDNSVQQDNSTGGETNNSGNSVQANVVSDTNNTTQNVSSSNNVVKANESDQKPNVNEETLTGSNTDNSIQRKKVIGFVMIFIIIVAAGVYIIKNIKSNKMYFRNVENKKRFLKFKHKNKH
jgi:beta-lactamase regulating signal transducer with metallopeptidase domain